MLRVMNDGNATYINREILLSEGCTETEINQNIKEMVDIGLIKRMHGKDWFFVNPKYHCVATPYYKRIFQKEYDSLSIIK